MAKKRVTRKQLLKEPDEFITTTGKVISWAKNNTKALVIGGGVFFGLVIFLSVFGYLRQSGAYSAELMFGQAVSKYQQLEAEQKSDADALSVVSADLDALIESHGQRPAGQMGQIFYGHISLIVAAYDEAIGHYQKALDGYGRNSSLTNIILNGLGTAYHQKGEYTQAIEHFRKIADGPGTVLKDVALFKLGKLYHKIDKSEESKKAYETLNTLFPNSMYADIIRNKIAG